MDRRWAECTEHSRQSQASSIRYPDPSIAVRQLANFAGRKWAIFVQIRL